MHPKYAEYGSKRQKKKRFLNLFYGEPGGIRTHDLLIRRNSVQVSETLMFTGFAGCFENL